jgi:hypothetical protein
MTGHIEKTVFISYRRTNLPWALAIYQDLHHHGYDVFFDYLSIDSGDFEQVIIGNIKARAHFIVLLTPISLERCNNPYDWLRREIETALDAHRNIVPVTLEGFTFGGDYASKNLIGKLANLKKYTSLNVPADYFDEAMKRLRERFLEVSLDMVLRPLSTNARRTTFDQQFAANSTPSIDQNELTTQEKSVSGNYIKELYATGVDIKNIAFAPKSGWAIVYSKGCIHSGIPQQAANKIKELVAKGVDIKNIAFAPNSGCAILYSSECWYVGIP